MRRRPATVLIFFLVIGAALILWMRGKQGASTNSEGDVSQIDLPVSGRSLSPAASEGESKGVTATTPGIDERAELASLDQMIQMLAENAKADRTVDQVVEFLNRTKQEPVVARDSNEYTGEMTIVRTKSPLPGTRYFYGQFFSDGKGGASFPQHLSFEFRASPKAFANVVTAIRKEIPSLAEPEIVKSGFMQWDAGNGFVVEVKQLAADDVQEDGVNPRTPEDVGTISITFEIAPHEGER